jgi:subtilisin family serine protease
MCVDKQKLKIKKMKVLKTTITTLLISLITVVSFGQKSSVWATVENVNQLQRNQELISVMVENHIDLTYYKAFPSSRQEKLQNVYEFSCECDVVTLYSALHKVSGLKGIEYGPTYETLETPNDYSLISTTNWALDLIGAQNAWVYTTGDPTLNVAVSDQNFYNNHEELNGKINYYDNTNTSTRTHGTAVATIVAGNTNNATGLSSIGYNTTLNLYRMNYNDMLNASYNGAKVINLSWASGCSFNTYAQMAIDEVYNNGTFIVASAGNGTTCGGPNSLVYPASYNHVFAVTSVGSQDNIERTIGNQNTRHQTNSSVDICAPGFDVPLTAAPGWYLTSSGTSFAAPYVTGTIALMLSVKPNLTNQEIDSILRLTATNIDVLNPNYVGKIGSGRLNSGLAVQMVWEMTQVVEEDGNNGHGNDEGGFDSSNPSQGNGNNGNQGGNGNHFGWDKNDKTTLGEDISNMAVIDINGRTTNLENALPGYYLVVNNGIITKKIYKN